MKISWQQFVNNLLTSSFFPYKNLCALLPLLIREFREEIIKNPDNHLDISSFLPPPYISFCLFLSKKKALFPLAVFYILLFVYFSALDSLSPSPTRVRGPSSLPQCEYHYPRDIRKFFRCKQKHKSPCLSFPTLFSSLFPYPPLHKYVCMFSHLQRLRVEHMKSEANKTSACFSLVINSTISLLNSRIYHVTVHDSGPLNCSCIVYILSHSLSENLGLIILLQQQSYRCHLIKSISYTLRHLEVSEESQDTAIAFIYSQE